MQLNSDEYMRTHDSGLLGELVDKSQCLHHRVAQFLVSKSPGLGVFELFDISYVRLTVLRGYRERVADASAVETYLREEDHEDPFGICT